MEKQGYTAAKAKANKKWNEKNKDRMRYINARSAARSFIRNKSTLDDLQELQKLIDQRRIDLKEQ